MSVFDVSWLFSKKFESRVLILETRLNTPSRGGALSKGTWSPRDHDYN